MLSETCRSLLADSRRFSTTYGRGLFNHLPMALLALERLGADDGRLRQFYSFYSKRLHERGDGVQLPTDDWRTALGKRQYEIGLASLFADQLRALGRDAFCRSVLPHLTGGIASEAFHGAIRTAYALDSGDDVDLPGAVAAWVTGFGELRRADRGVARRFETISDAFSSIASDDRFADPPEGNSIVSRLAKADALAAFDDYRGCVARLDLKELATIATRLYAATANFTALHLVTACHSVRLLQPFLAEEALETLSTAMLAAYVAIGRPAIPEELDLREARDLSALAAQAVRRDDDHDLKLVYTCIREEQEYGLGVHRMAAAVRLGFVPPDQRG